NQSGYVVINAVALQISAMRIPFSCLVVPCGEAAGSPAVQWRGGEAALDSAITAAVPRRLSLLASSTAAAGLSRTMEGRRRTTMSQEFVGPLTVTSLQGVQGGSLELGTTLGGAPETPYVDFHFGLEAAQDFNVRLINPADNRLDVVP